MRVNGFLGEDLRKVPDAVRRLEELGFDRANAAEIKHSPVLALTLAAEHSTRIGLGTAITIAFARSPYVTALEAWNLQDYSNGRIAIGLGTQVKGHIEKRYSMPWTKPVGPRMREYIQLMRAVWDTFQNGTKPDFRGEHYTFTLMSPFFDSGPISVPPPKIALAGVGPYMCQVAGEVADILMLHSFTTPKYVREVQIPALEKGLANAGRDRSTFEVQAGTWFCPGRDKEELEAAKRPVREAISFYGSTRTYAPVWENLGMPEMTPRLHEMSLRGEWKAMAELIDDEILDEFAIVGAPDEIIPKFIETYGGIVDSIGIGDEREGASMFRDDREIADTVAKVQAVESPFKG
jgi:probable F420-dependent oxidoreductase